MTVETDLEVVPANQASCDDLQLVFGNRGIGYVCQCQRSKLGRGESLRIAVTE